MWNLTCCICYELGVQNYHFWVSVKLMGYLYSVALGERSRLEHSYPPNYIFVPTSFEIWEILPHFQDLVS